MPIFTTPIPLSLYIHLPWCVRKCPYCDFNSHEMKGSLPETAYVAALLQNIEDHLPLIQDRSLISLFFGGGTPSLFSAQAIEAILQGISQRLRLHPAIEITLEANPGTVDQVRFHDFYQAGINRLSLGIQSFQSEQLKRLGRIHDREQALRAIDIAKTAGFTNINLDIMYGLPQQTIEEALTDINTALACDPTHFSWYQLTLEPNTLFYHQPPTLPSDDTLWDMQTAGQARIAQHGFQQYEVSAYARSARECVHNHHYWEFGDYLGIGAGAHSKLTDPASGRVIRFAQAKHPKDYLDAEKRRSFTQQCLTEHDLIFEFMLNALRLTHGVPTALFTERTGLPLHTIAPLLAKALQKDLLLDDPSRICPSDLGKRFLNDLVGMFLEK